MSASKQTTTLLLVDVQKDFHPGGSLAIGSADEDADRIASMIRQHADKIDRIVLSMDSHQKLHIANPSFWCSGDDEKKRPDPFTIISLQDLEAGLWKPRSDLQLPLDSSGTYDGSVFEGIDGVLDGSGKLCLEKYCIEYARRLEKKGRFKICIWPEHCLIGSPGHAVVDSIKAALHEWTERTGRSAEWIMKGQNILTENFSLLEAEVPVSKETSFDEAAFSALCHSDRLLVCGQAMSHCVNYSTRDIVKKWPSNETHKIILLTDCASSVPGFEEAGETFQNDMKAAGVKLMKASEAF